MEAADKPRRRSSSSSLPKLKPAGVSTKKQVAELHHATTLVGRIVEKGFSSSTVAATKPPQPSLLPFPVARHRSRGPHWAPAAAAARMDVDEDDEADRDEMDYDPVSSFANPVQRKQKKGLAFSRWRDFVSTSSTSASRSEREGSDLIVSGEENKRISSANSSIKTSGLTGETTTKEGSSIEKDSVLEPKPIVQTESKEKARIEEEIESVDLSTRELLNGSSSMEVDTREGKRHDYEMESQVLKSNGLDSLVDGIDVENLTRLQQMSSDEIAEAHAEIMEKMDAGIVEMLRKRGRDKLENKKGGGSEQCKDPQEPGSKEPVQGSKSSAMGAATGSWASSSPQSSSSSWKAWSERVEKVREMRFSLEGNPVEIDLTVEQPNGIKQEYSPHNVESVAERDFLRTEGDPASLGYTIKEVVTLMRSMVPGQRALALQLLANVLSKALHNLQKKDVGDSMEKSIPISKYIDWQAIWAFALGPEPEMALALRIALDDNHDVVVLACAKTIQCILSCEINESLFSIIENLPMHEKSICTAPVFRSRPDSDGGFLHGGYWKYSAKPSNIIPYTDRIEDVENEERTIQDDVTVAGQDVAAGLIRMGILPRICYLLEMDPLPTLEESLVSILIALARHSPTSADAIMRCPRLVETAVKMFTKQGSIEIRLAQIKAITLLKHNSRKSNLYPQNLEFLQMHADALDVALGFENIEPGFAWPILDVFSEHVLSQSNRQICLDFVRRGTFQEVMWHWYKSAFTLDHWIKYGREYCRLSSALMVEQLRYWKVCIRYGYCIAYFADFFPAMCLWLSPPTFEKLIGNNLLREFTSITTEAYLVLEALAQRLPRLHSVEQLNNQRRNLSDCDMEAWSWGHVVPMVDVAINWLSLKNIPYLSTLIGCEKGSTTYGQNGSQQCIVWVISAVLQMLCTIFAKIAPENVDGDNESSAYLPWLPQFVPSIGLEIVKNGFLNFLSSSDMELDVRSSDKGSLVEGLCYLRHKNDPDVSLASVSCLHGLVRLICLVDESVKRARSVSSAHSRDGYKSEMADKILEEGIIIWAKHDLVKVLNVFTNLVSSEWLLLQSVETFGRGGPAPGIGVGWGSSGGGFWSPTIFLARLDAQLILTLSEIFPPEVSKDFALGEGLIRVNDVSEDATTVNPQMINSVLGVCLIAGPGDRAAFEKALDILLQTNVLKYLSSCAHYFQSNKGLKLYDWQSQEQDYLSFRNILKSHFKNRWLSIKKKPSDEVNNIDHNQDALGRSSALETIHEDLETSETIHEDLETSEIALNNLDCSSLLVEWAHQRLPLPVHWFLSTISNVGDFRNTSVSSSLDVLNVAKCGLFFLLGLETMCAFSGSDFHATTISSVPLVWKFHALSVALHANMNVLEEQTSRDMFETLQDLFGQQLDQLRVRLIQAPSKINENFPLSYSFQESRKNDASQFLNFRTQIHESYTTFVENLIEQFGAISYGDMIYGRQVALYLHQSVDPIVRLAVWNTLSNAHILELLPTLEKCIGEAEGYLDPVEENEGVLEAYVKSWMSGSLDKAATRRSVSFTLALHHLSCFIFKCSTSDKVALRNRLAKSLLRSSCQKQHREGMLLDFVCYKYPMSQESLQQSELVRRFGLLKEVCEGNSSLVLQVEKIRLSVE